jgi:hypothetical protein
LGDGADLVGYFLVRPFRDRPLLPDHHRRRDLISALPSLIHVREYRHEAWAFVRRRLGREAAPSKPRNEPPSA